MFCFSISTSKEPLYNAINILPKIGFRSGPLITDEKPYYFFPISKSVKFPYITQSKLTQNDGTLIKNISCDPIFINRGCEPLFHHPILLLIFNYHKLKTQLQPNKKYRMSNPFLFFMNWGSFSNREKRLLGIVMGFMWLNRDKHGWY